MASASVTPLDYESPRHRRLRCRDPAKRRFGVASCTCWGVAVAVVGLSFFIAASSSSMGREAAGPVIAGVLVAWIASIAGTVLGMIGALPLYRRGEFALAGLILNLVTCLSPFALCMLSSGPPC